MAGSEAPPVLPSISRSLLGDLWSYGWCSPRAASPGRKNRSPEPRGEAFTQPLVLGAVEGSLLAALAALVWCGDRETNLTPGYTTPCSDTPDPSLSFAEPLAPSSVSLSSQGSPYSLLASWDEAAGEGYMLALSPAEQPVENSLLLRGVTNFTYEGLHPATLYTFEVSTVAGPYTSSPQRITNWTCECRSPHRSQPRGSHWVLPFPMTCHRACASTGLLQLHTVKCQKDQEESRGAAGCVLLWSVP